MAQIKKFECCGSCQHNHNWKQCSTLPHVAVNGQCVDLKEYPAEGHFEDLDEPEQYSDPYFDDY